MLQMRKNKKGFTLVEVVVVLVILAILAAILVPTLTGYIDKANERTAAAQFHLMTMAVKAAVAEVGWDKIQDSREEIIISQVEDLTGVGEVERAIHAYLDPDMKGQYTMFLSPGAASGDVQKMIDSGALYYFPEAGNYKTYYTCSNGEITYTRG